MSRVIPDDPDAYAKTKSLGDLLAATRTGTIHILFVHGMAATGRDNSRKFREALAEHLASTGQLQAPAPANPEIRPLLDREPRPTEANFNGTKIWTSDESWERSKPFVERYTFRRIDRSDVIVDDINWWPLLFALKCRFIVSPEADLTGADAEHLKLCACEKAPYYPWLTKKELDDLLARQPKAGRGASTNIAIKRSIMSWGLSDSAMALGPMHAYFRQAMNEAFQYAQPTGETTADGEFVIVSASLGSFVVLDALFNEGCPTEAGIKVATRSSLLYFFANQWALLELGRIQGLPGCAVAEQQGEVAKTAGGPVNLLTAWVAAGRRGGVENARPKQIIAFSDPSDILTYRVPKIDGAVVVNLYDRNEIRWLWLFANPTKAHTGHAENPAVLESIFATHN